MRKNSIVKVENPDAVVSPPLHGNTSTLSPPHASKNLNSKTCPKGKLQIIPEPKTDP